MIKDRETGKVEYRLFADGSNRKADGQSIADPVKAIELFLSFKSMRFGRDGTRDNRFKRGSPFVKAIGATTSFRLANPKLIW